MKKIFLLLMLLSLSGILFAIDFKGKLTRLPKTKLPFERTKIVRHIQPRYALIEGEIEGLPLRTYKDLGLIQKTDYDNDASIFRQFDISSNTYELLAVNFSKPDSEKELLVTYTSDGKIIDFIESAVSFAWRGVFFIKQWRMNEGGGIIVTHIKIDSPAPISAFSDFGPVRGQRIDTSYEIDASGRFHKVKEVKYQFRDYSKTYLEDRTINLWEGDEAVIE